MEKNSSGEDIASTKAWIPEKVLQIEGTAGDYQQEIAGKRNEESNLPELCCLKVAIH